MEVAFLRVQRKGGELWPRVTIQAARIWVHPVCGSGVRDGIRGMMFGRRPAYRSTVGMESFRGVQAAPVDFAELIASGTQFDLRSYASTTGKAIDGICD